MINGTPTKVENKQTTTTSSSSEIASSLASIETFTPDEKIKISIPEEVIFEEIVPSESTTDSVVIESATNEVVSVYGSDSIVSEGETLKKQPVEITTGNHESFSDSELASLNTTLLAEAISSGVWTEKEQQVVQQTIEKVPEGAANEEPLPLNNNSVVDLNSIVEFC